MERINFNEPPTEKFCRITFHLGSGVDVNIETPMEDEASAEDVTTELFEAVKRGPGWIQIDTLAVFTGTVSAIEVDEL